VQAPSSPRRHPRPPDRPAVTAGGDRTRQRIVDAALDIIGRHGVRGLTNRAVAAAAQVSLGSVTYHFPSQRALLRTCLLAFADQEAARMADIARRLAEHPVPPAAAAVAAEDAVEATVVGPRHLGVLELYLQAARDPALADACQQCWDSYEQAARSILDALGVEDAALPHQVVALVAGFQLRRVATGTPIGGRLAAGLARLAGIGEPPGAPHDQ
jgi:DNA-binding transcriptional regulator YbjK